MNYNNYDFNGNFKDKENYTLNKKHTKKNENHSNKRNEIIKSEFTNNKITENKLENLDYCELFLKEFCIRNISLRKELMIDLWLHFCLSMND